MELDAHMKRLLMCVFYALLAYGPACHGSKKLLLIFPSELKVSLLQHMVQFLNEQQN